MVYIDRELVNHITHVIHCKCYQLMLYRERCFTESSIINNRNQHTSGSIIFRVCNNLDLVGYTWQRHATNPTVITHNNQHLVRLYQ